MAPLKVGIVGCGKIAQLMHLPFLHERPDRFEIKAICDLDPAILTAIQQRYPSVSAYTTVDDLLDNDLDAVFILTSTSHVDEILKVAATGRAIFVEKPLCYSLSQAERIAAAVAESGSRLMVGYMKRFDPAVRYAAKALGAAHGLRLVQGHLWLADEERYLAPHRLHRPGSSGDEMIARFNQTLDHDTVGRSLGRQQRNAYFSLLTSGIHNLNLLRALLGAPERIISSTLYHDGWSGALQLVYPNNVLALWNWTYLAQGVQQDTLNFLADDLQLNLRFASPYLYNVPTSVRLTTLGADNEILEQQATVSYQQPFKLEHEHFYEYATGKLAAETSLSDALHDIQLIAAIVSEACIL
jgi:predicted dehydrogenase